jgi:hypothetical protein
MGRRPRTLASAILAVVAFVGAYLFLFPSACAEVDGMPSWERCTTLAGTPAFSLTDWGLDNMFDILIPVVVAVLAGGLSWWLLGKRNTARNASTD